MAFVLPTCYIQAIAVDLTSSPQVVEQALVLRVGAHDGVASSEL